MFNSKPSKKKSGWWFQPLWKLLVSRDYYSQYMETQKCGQPPTRLAIFQLAMLVFQFGSCLFNPTLSLPAFVWHRFHLAHGRALAPAQPILPPKKIVKDGPIGDHHPKNYAWTLQIKCQPNRNRPVLSMYTGFLMKVHESTSGIHMWLPKGRIIWVCPRLIHHG